MNFYLYQFRKIEKFRGSETAKLKIKYVESSSTENAKKETAEYHAKYVAVSTEVSEIIAELFIITLRIT